MEQNDTNQRHFRLKTRLAWGYIWIQDIQIMNGNCRQGVIPEIPDCIVGKKQATPGKRHGENAYFRKDFGIQAAVDLKRSQTI